MGGALARGMALVGEAVSRLSLRRERAPIDTVEALSGFVSTRAAFVAQKKLYGYLKARMGTRYPSMFEDETFICSVNIAKMHVFAACLADLSVHAAARVAASGRLSDAEARDLARHCHAAGIADNAAQLPQPGLARTWQEAFAGRAAAMHWQNAGLGGDVFAESPTALFQWAPVADHLKRLDREIIENSIRFAFAEVTRSLRQRTRPASIADGWRRRQGGAERPGADKAGSGAAEPALRRERPAQTE